jgi:outer membrane protein assembly factor BamB
MVNLTRSGSSIRRQAAVLLLPALLLILTARIPAQNWPQFRGPGGQGLSGESGLPVKWSGTSNVRWKTALPGPGHSSPVVWGGRIFLTAFRSERSAYLPRFLFSPRGQLVVLGLDRTTGKILWERVVATERIEEMHPTNSPASPTPVTDGRHVFVYFGSFGLLCFDVDGNVVWEKRLGPYPNEWGSASSPVLHGDVLLLNVDTDADDYLLAVDKRTGRTRWQTPRGPVTRSWPSPFIWTTGGREEIVISGSGRVKGYDPGTGRELWAVDGLTTWVAPTPVSGHDGLLYVAANGPGGNIIMAIRPGGRGNVTGTHVAWRHERGAPYISSPVLVGDYLYVVRNGGIMTCLNARTGAVVWQERLPARGDYYASLVAADGKIYAINEDGEVTVVAAQPSFQVLGVNMMGERTMASPAIAGGQIFIRTDDSLYAIGAAGS